jgi:hypothetical protein
MIITLPDTFPSGEKTAFATLIYGLWVARFGEI